MQISDRHLSAIPDGYRWITWEIGTRELQKSAMAVETFEALRAGITNVERVRAIIRQRRKLLMQRSAGKWSATPSDRFINEHAWVLSMMTQFDMIPAVDRRTKETSLLSNADDKLSTLVDYFQRNEPFLWQPGDYKQAQGW